jgi:hypothetical protein
MLIRSYKSSRSNIVQIYFIKIVLMGRKEIDLKYFCQILLNNKFGNLGFKSERYVYWRKIKIIDDRFTLIKLSKKNSSLSALRNCPLGPEDALFLLAGRAEELIPYPWFISINKKLFILIKRASMASSRTTTDIEALDKIYFFYLMMFSSCSASFQPANSNFLAHLDELVKNQADSTFEHSRCYLNNNHIFCYNSGRPRPIILIFFSRPRYWLDNSVCKISSQSD